MHLTLSRKLWLIGFTAGLVFALLTAIGLFAGERMEHQIEDIEARYVPLLELGPQLEADLARLRTGFRDAVAAQDADTLDAMTEVRDALLERIASSEGMMRPGEAVELQAAVARYFRVGGNVSARLIRGETGEAIVHAMTEMQREHEGLLSQLQHATVVDRRTLKEAFSSLRAASRAADLLRMVVALVCLGLVAGLSSWVGRGILRSLSELSSGFVRFGEGDFTRPMKVSSKDELGEAAAAANRMASKLQQLDEQRRLADWLKSGLGGLAVELQGELGPVEVCQRSIAFLARHIGAAVGALYTRKSSGEFELSAEYGISGTPWSGALEPELSPREGLFGEAAGQSQIMIIPDPPPGGLRIRTGLLDSAPVALALVPILHRERVEAVLELGILSRPNAVMLEYLSSTRDLIARVLEVARGQAAQRALLGQTQAQAAKLQEQEELLRNANEELRLQQAELERVNEGLRQQTSELESFSYSVSHDLRAPLRAIDGFARILIEDHAGALDAEGLRVAKVICTNTRKMGQLIDDLLAFSRLGRQSIQLRPVDMARLAQEAFDDAAAAEPGRTVTLDLGEMPKARADESMLRHVWANLCTNAVKYTRGVSEAKVRVRGQIGDGEIIYSVSDNGVGFDMKYAGKLFQVFQRLHSGEDFEGTGVGLAVVSRIVKRHGGRVWGEGKLAQGATFYFSLPTQEEVPDGA